MSDIDNGCPSDFEPYEKALIKGFEYEDEKAWRQGYYNYIALSVALSHLFGGKKRIGDKTADYPEKPLTMLKETREMTKAEFDALSDKEKERVTMQSFEVAMQSTLDSFNRMKGKDNG